MTEFSAAFASYKRAVDEDIRLYTAHVRRVTRQQYGEHPSAVTNEYLDLLSRGGKRIRGALVMVGYEMLGGSDTQMIARAATAIEMLHAALLVIDDIQDHDTIRRGKPAVHVALADYHQKMGMGGSAKATGIGLALNAALTGLHAAQVLLAGLEADPEQKIKVIGIVNNTFILAAHGQTYDIVTAGQEHPHPDHVARATEWKSAHYTFLNPLCVGMVLANAGCEDTDAIREYALHTGIAFQLVDDMLDGDVAPEDRVAVRGRIVEHVQSAQAALQSHAPHWNPGCVQFLHDLAAFVAERKT